MIGGLGLKGRIGQAGRAGLVRGPRLVGETGLGLSCNAWTFTEWMDTVLVEDEVIGSDQVMVLGEMGP